MVGALSLLLRCHQRRRLIAGHQSDLFVGIIAGCLSVPFAGGEKSRDFDEAWANPGQILGSYLLDAGKDNQERGLSPRYMCWTLWCRTATSKSRLQPSRPTLVTKSVVVRRSRPSQFCLSGPHSKVLSGMLWSVELVHPSAPR